MRTGWTALLLLLLTAAPAAAEFGGVDDAWLGPGECVGIATPVTVAEISAHPDRWLNKCVAVRGYFWNGRLFEDRDALYRGSPVSFPEEGSPQNVIGEYGTRHRKQAWPSWPVFAVVTGLIGTCQPINTINYGFCAFGNQHRLVVRSSKVMFGSRTLQRATGEVERDRVGDLEPVDATWPHYAFATSRVLAWLAAAHVGDVREMGKLDGYVGEPYPTHPSYHAILTAKSGPLAELRDRSRSMQISVFELTTDPRSHRGPEAFSAVVCFCRFRSCNAVWPISHLDAEPGRPYACVSVGRDDRSSPAMSMGVSSRTTGGAKEPSWTIAAAGGERRR